MQNPETPPTPSDQSTVLKVHMCAVKLCNKPADYLPRIREKGRNAIGIILGLPMCHGCSLETKLEHLMAESQMPMIKKLLKQQGQYPKVMGDLEVAWMGLETTEARMMLKRLK